MAEGSIQNSNELEFAVSLHVLRSDWAFSWMQNQNEGLCCIAGTFWKITSFSENIELYFDLIGCRSAM